MIITINEAEIKEAVATYIESRGIHNVSDDNVTMIASRGPTGMTAEIKLAPKAVIVVTDTRESFSGDRDHPAPQAEAVKEEDSKVSGKATSDEEPVKDVEPEDTATLFDK